MRTFHKLKNHYHCPIINLDKIWTLVGEEVRAGAASPNPGVGRRAAAPPRRACGLALRRASRGGDACCMPRFPRAIQPPWRAVATHERFVR